MGGGFGWDLNSFWNFCGTFYKHFSHIETPHKPAMKEGQRLWNEEELTLAFESLLQNSFRTIAQPES